MATGWPQVRADATLKVTGSAKFSADFSAPDMAYAVLVTSKIAKGRVAHLDAAAAEASDGVIRVFTHQNAMRLNRPKDVMAYPLVGPFPTVMTPAAISRSRLFRWLASAR